MCYEIVSPYDLAPVGAVNTEKCRWGIRARMIYEGSLAYAFLGVAIDSQIGQIVAYSFRIW